MAAYNSNLYSVKKKKLKYIRKDETTLLVHNLFIISKNRRILNTLLAHMCTVHER